MHLCILLNHFIKLYFILCSKNYVPVTIQENGEFKEALSGLYIVKPPDQRKARKSKERKATKETATYHTLQAQ